MSGRMGGEEEPKVHVVYDVHIVQRYEEKMRRVTCFRLIECEEVNIDEGEEYYPLLGQLKSPGKRTCSSFLRVKR